MKKNDILNKISDIDKTPLLLKIIDQIKCFICLDTNKLWKNRSNLPFDAWDGRGSYDIIKCNSCSDGAWLQCSRSNNIIINNHPIFNHNNKNIDERIMYLKTKCKVQKEQLKSNRVILDEENNTLAKSNSTDNLILPIKEESKIKEESIVELVKVVPTISNDSPKWKISLKRKLIKDLTSIKIDIALQQLASDITKIIAGCSGDIIALPSLVENMTFSISGTIENSTDENHSIRKIDLENGGEMFIELNFSKGIVTEDSICCWYQSHFNRTKLIVDVLIYEPENDVAMKICENKMSTVVAQIMELDE